jgi:hypothetical protein
MDICGPCRGLPASQGGHGLIVTDALCDQPESARATPWFPCQKRANSKSKSVTGADSRANHYRSEFIRRRRVSKRLFPLVLAIAALSIVRVRAREFVPVTQKRTKWLQSRV